MKHKKINKCIVVEICSSFTVRCRFDRALARKRVVCSCVEAKKKGKIKSVEKIQVSVALCTSSS